VQMIEAICLGVRATTWQCSQYHNAVACGSAIQNIHTAKRLCLKAQGCRALAATLSNAWIGNQPQRGCVRNRVDEFVV